MYDWQRILDSDHLLNPYDHILIPFSHGDNEVNRGPLHFSPLVVQSAPYRSLFFVFLGYDDDKRNRKTRKADRLQAFVTRDRTIIMFTLQPYNEMAKRSWLIKSSIERTYRTEFRAITGFDFSILINSFLGLFVSLVCTGDMIMEEVIANEE